MHDQSRGGRISEYIEYIHILHSHIVYTHTYTYFLIIYLYARLDTIYIHTGMI